MKFDVCFVSAHCGVAADAISHSSDLFCAAAELEEILSACDLNIEGTICGRPLILKESQ